MQGFALAAGGWERVAPMMFSAPEELAEEALKAAKRRGLTVSCDLNYRKKLWPPKAAQAIFPRLLMHIDVLIGNEEDAANALDMAPEGVDVRDSEYSLEPYAKIEWRFAVTKALKPVGGTNELTVRLAAPINAVRGKDWDDCGGSGVRIEREDSKGAKGCNHYLYGKVPFDLGKYRREWLPLIAGMGEGVAAETAYS